VTEPHDKEPKERVHSMKGTRSNTKKAATTEKKTTKESNLDATVGQYVSAVSIGKLQT
jgi:hypothetical protein